LIVETTKLASSRVDPLIGGLLDSREHLTDGGCGVSETPRIPLLPKLPRYQGEESVGLHPYTATVYKVKSDGCHAACKVALNGF